MKLQHLLILFLLSDPGKGFAQPDSKLRLAPLTDGVYNIRHSSSGKYVTVQPANGTENMSFVYSDKSGSINQQFQIQRTDEGSYTLIPLQKEVFLTAGEENDLFAPVKPGSGEESLNWIIKRLNPAEDQCATAKNILNKWGIIHAASGMFMTTREKYLNIQNGEKVVAELPVYSYGSKPCPDGFDIEPVPGAVMLHKQAKEFSAKKITPLADGIYKIRVNHTGKYLAVEGASKDNGARLVQWDDANQPNHQFKLRSIGNGYYEISALHSHRFLNASGQSKQDGTPVIQWDYAAQDNVKWHIFYAEQTGKPGWVLENKGASPIRLQAGLADNRNGEPFVLMMPRRQDAHDVEPYQTFTFVRLGDLPFSESKLYEQSPGMKPQKIKQ